MQPVSTRPAVHARTAAAVPHFALCALVDVLSTEGTLPKLGTVALVLAGSGTGASVEFTFVLTWVFLAFFRATQILGFSN